jgi:hypothetical protein
MRALRRVWRSWLVWTCRNLRQSFVVGVTAAVALLTCVAGVVAQQEVVRHEYAIKAGVLGVLGKCVTWPSEAAPITRGDPLKIGILGRDPFVENGVNQLDRFVAEEKLKGRNIVVKRFSSAKDYEFCHILFVSSLPANEGATETVADRVQAANKASEGSTVLIVGESTGLARQGAVANLVFDRTTNLIRLEINPDAAARAGLKLAPDLLRLKLVEIVRDSKG